MDSYNASVPKVTVIIPNWNGEVLLRRCLSSLKKTEYPDYRILIVDNASTDRSIAMLEQEFPDVDILVNSENFGYAGGCNAGILHCRSPFLVLLNNDAEVTPGWLIPLMREMERVPALAAVQPKVLSTQDRNRFDYCGAAGGEMDLFAYPYASGRLFETMEIDTGQYDRHARIFWSTGAVTLLRRSAVETVGLFDHAFFAHMEEIDQCWRFYLAGYEVRFVPDSIVYHQTGGTLTQESLKKMVLNHRNSILMLMKNYTWSTLCWVLPLRLILEGLSLIAFFLKGQPKRSLAVLLGIWGVIIHFKTIVGGRKQVAAIRKVHDGIVMHRMYRESVALAYFLFGRRTVRELIG